MVYVILILFRLPLFTCVSLGLFYSTAYTKFFSSQKVPLPSTCLSNLYLTTRPTSFPRNIFLNLLPFILPTKFLLGHLHKLIQIRNGFKR